MPEKRYRLILSLVVWITLFLVGCNIPPTQRLPVVESVLPTISLAPTSSPLMMIGVTIHVADNASTVPEVKAGEQITVILDFRPSIVTIHRGSDGEILYTSWQDWESHPVKKMRGCFSTTNPCQPEGVWQPFNLSLTHNLSVDWVGTQDIFASIQFLDNQGASVLAGDLNLLQPTEVLQVSIQVISRADPAQVVGTMSPHIQTAQAATQSAFPVTGAVKIANGACCAGGKANSEINLEVEFQAESSAGVVNEMRLLTGGQCFRDLDSLDAPWEPFVTKKILTTTLALNWIGFYVNVQFRDTQGYLSPVICDDISLEGSP